MSQKQRILQLRSIYEGFIDDALLESYTTEEPLACI
jgi:hypothetical protein